MSKKSIVILIIIFVIIVIGALGVFLWFMSSKLSAITGKLGDTVEEETGGTKVEDGIGPVYNLETFIVNLADPGSKRYLRVTMSLEVDKEDVETEIKKRLPQVKHKILMILPTKKVADIQSVDGKKALMAEIQNELNGLLKNGHVTNIYFTEFVVQ